MKKYATKRLLITLVIVGLMLASITAPISASQYGRYQSSTIQITPPSQSIVDKMVTVEGSTSLENIWLCIKGPAGELSVYPMDVHNGNFKKDIWLRFGTGTYTIYAGDNAKRFDGAVSFNVTNTSKEDYQYLKSSGYVDSESPEVTKIVETITNEKMTDLQKANAIHKWVTGNISYDYKAYAAGISAVNTTSSVIESKVGICRDYAFIFAALARNAGIPTKIVYGDALNSKKTLERHAWNEAYVNGKWINIDTTWDAGYIKNKAFVRNQTVKYFNTSAEVFAKTHTVTSTTLF